MGVLGEWRGLRGSRGGFSRWHFYRPGAKILAAPLFIIYVMLIHFLKGNVMLMTGKINSI